jgi:TrmH family RNA methyltransferase
MNRIESPRNSKVKEWKKLHSKKGREQTNCFIIEGPHLVHEALKHQAPILEIIIEESFRIPLDWDVGSITTWAVTERVIKVLSDTDHPQGVIAICEIEAEDIKLIPNGRYLLLDNVQDPGNVGTMIRTADSAGLDGVVLGNGTVDLYNSKVLRSTQGSLFHLHVAKGDLIDWINRFREAEIPIYGTSLQGGVPYSELEPSSGYALVVGNEGNGVQKSILSQTDQNVYIPIYGKAESLNVAVATGILVYGLSTKNEA